MSVKGTVGQMNIGQMIVGQMKCRSNELSVKWTVGQMNVGQTIVGQMIVGQMTQTPLNYTLKYSWVQSQCVQFIVVPT
jgi:hypothetical protein